ncbi:MAG TPA: LysE family transporter, partial [Verrucomicrobiota bacterium]|nr:LysE family transporter [Verrucomicrobiota bacterium]
MSAPLVTIHWPATLMRHMKLFWSGFLLSLSLCLDLGIVNVALIRTGIQRGATRSFALGAGSCFGDLFYAAIAMLGVSVFLQSPPVRWALWLCGSAVLLGFAVKMFREGHSPRSLDTVRVPMVANHRMAEGDASANRM